MGASYDSRLAGGKTFAEAFRNATEQAGWEEGHGGYSGSLYEKHDATLFTAPVNPKTRKPVPASKFYEWVGIWGEEGEEAVAEMKAELKREESRRAAPGQGAAKRERVKRYRGYVREMERNMKKVPEWARYEVARCAAVAHGDKWGPAAAIELTGSEYRAAKERLGLKGKRDIRIFKFFGTCSS